jgi:hypothetical protein
MTTNEIPNFTGRDASFDGDPIDAPASYDIADVILNPRGENMGEWSIEAIQGDNVTLDVTLSMSSRHDMDAAINALIKLKEAMAQAEEFRGER